MFTASFVFAALAASLVPVALAHGSVSTAIINGQSYDGPWPADAGPNLASPVRQIGDLFPVKDVTSSDITCGLGASSTANVVAEVAAGSSVQLWWRSGAVGTPWPHVYGPLMSYLAQCDSTADKCDASKAKFFKIEQMGLRPDLSWYQSEINAGHSFNITIPAGIPNGDYLMRTEIVALHNAMQAGYAEFYVDCIQLRVTGGGNLTPSADQLVSFPGAYSANDPGILINVFPGANGPLSTYPFPGPALFTGSGSSSGGDPPSGPVDTAPTPTPSSPPTTTSNPHKATGHCRRVIHSRGMSRVMRRISQLELEVAS